MFAYVQCNQWDTINSYLKYTNGDDTCSLIIDMILFDWTFAKYLLSSLSVKSIFNFGSGPAAIILCNNVVQLSKRALTVTILTSHMVLPGWIVQKQMSM